MSKPPIQYHFGFDLTSPPRCPFCNAQHDGGQDYCLPEVDDDPNMLPHEIDVDWLVDFVKTELRELNQKIRERVENHDTSDIQRNHEGRGGTIPRRGILEKGSENRGRNLGDVQNRDWDELQRALENTRNNKRRKD
jgi:hypothetical protein